MSKKIDWEIFSRSDIGRGVTPKASGVKFTSDRRTARQIAFAMRLAHYQDFQVWRDFFPREQKGPINSHKNAILREFRDHLGGLIDPYIPREASWWLELIKKDPWMEDPNYWGTPLVDSVNKDSDTIDSAVRVLTRLKNLGF